MNNRLEHLSERIDDMISLVRTLREENRQLRESGRLLEAENGRLAEKTREAKERVDSIIARLRQTGDQA